MTPVDVVRRHLVPGLSDLRPGADQMESELLATPFCVGFSSGSSIFQLCAFALFLSSAMWVLRLWQKRRAARHMMEGGMCNLPTVLWRPRFINYAPDQDEITSQSLSSARAKMASSSIINMLPRMERLGGQYGMYSTIYGLSTRVVHVGHPVPARSILSGMGTSSGLSSGSGSVSDDSARSSPKQTQSRLSRQKRKSAFISSSGASKAPAYDHFKNFSGDGVFTADGDEWKAKRASVIHCLLRGITNDKSEGARRLEREANLAADGVIGNVERRRCSQLNDDVAASDICLNIVPVLQKSTVGLIYRYITHHDVDLCREGDDDLTSKKTAGVIRIMSEEVTCESSSLDSVTPKSSSTSLSSLAESSPKNAELSQETVDAASRVTNNSCSCGGTASLPQKLLGSYLKSVTHIRMIILAQSRSFWFLTPRWVYRTFSPMFREEEKTMGPIREFAQAACLNALPGSPLALLKDRPSHNTSQSSSAASVSKDMMDEAITLLFAGQDTSAATLSWTLHLLSLYPDVQERLSKEIAARVEERGIEGDKEGSFITKQLISDIPYLDAVIKESMRLYPVAPFVVRKLPQDVAIPPEQKSNDATILPKGSLACMWIYALHRNPRLWHRPDDFVPERWIDPQLKDLDKGQESGAFMPFANGPRNCVGQPLAHVILRIMLARLIRKYVFVEKRLEEMDDATTYATDLRKDMQAGFTVLPSGGVHLSLRRRSSK